MRRRGSKIFYSLLILILVTFFVLTINIYTGPYTQYDNENESIPKPWKPESSELKKRRDLSLKEIWLQKRIHRNRGAFSKFKGIYVREAYRVSDEEIRFIYLENQDNE
ncbi:hypothetical protein B9Z55_016038 [Caenorhabditis nigoni]|uniref:Uncharacterized protein n=1 Tax=Caenorhabditis nigoni TaxID=1611254 RepID=A0A2G5UD01_9PELO|nr:hypothetical protein B9Z55_016038 [Caenorhabditis nigoni]